MIPVKITQLSTNENPIHLTLDVGWVEKYKTVTGNPIVISDGVKDTLLTKLLVTLNPKQSGSGTPSPSNVRPISGWDSVDVSVCGVNVWDEEWEVGGINTSGQETSTSGYYRSKNYTAVLPNATYYFKVPTTMSVMFYDSNKDFIEWTTANNATITTPSNCRFLRFRNTTANTWTPYDNNISINYPSTDHEYHAYQGHTYTTDLPQTVYGGTLDVVSGVLTVDRAMVTLNTASMDNSEDYPGWRNSGVRNLMGAGINNVYNDAQTNVGRGMGVNTIGSNDMLLLLKSQYDLTQSQWQALAINAQIIVPLATPTTIQCDPQTVSLLAGENVVMGDGDMEITYRVKASA